MRDESLGSIKNSLNASPICNQKGQFAIEAVLLMTLLMGVLVAASNIAKKNEFGKKLVQDPMERIGRMAAYGTWNKECVAQGKSKKVSLGKCHPNSMSRALSSYPK